MTYPSPQIIGRSLARGLTSLIRHGNNHNVTTDYSPIASGGYKQLPPPSGAQKLQAVSTDAGDAAAGLGARTLLLTGVDAQGDEITEIITLDGTTLTPLTTQDFWRLNFADVLTSGTYGDAFTGSQLGVITIQDAGANIWAQIRINDFPHARWQTSWYTVPNGKRVFVNGYRIGVEATKQANIKLMGRADALNETAPFAPIQELTEVSGVSGAVDVDLPYLFGPLPPAYDLGGIAQMTASTGRVSLDLDLIIEVHG